MVSRRPDGVEDFFITEYNRNLKSFGVFERFLKRAFGPCTVSVSHHIVYRMGEGEVARKATPNEIPSADTLWFDCAVMSRVFGQDKAKEIMLHLARVEPAQREDVVCGYLGTMG